MSGSRTLVKDRWIDVRADRCLTPGGTAIEPYYVLTYPDWVHVVAITPGGELVLVRQYRHGAGDVFLELPAGTMDPGDPDPCHAARRELAEETGFEAGDWRHVVTLHANPALQTNRIHTLLATNAARRRQPDLDAGEEGLTVVTMPIDRVADGLCAGLLGQASQVSSLLLALRLFGA